jgi:DNA mismatch endonuclease (patch repair protein)
MRAIRSKGMKPEMVVRRMVRSLGIGYRLHRKDLPGKPDLAFIGRRKAIFVHGCYWHQHPECREGRPPNSNIEYWGPKLRRNGERDRAALQSLAAQGWQTLVVWECETSKSDDLRDRLERFLNSEKK